MSAGYIHAHRRVSHVDICICDWQKMSITPLFVITGPCWLTSAAFWLQGPPKGDHDLQHRQEGPVAGHPHQAC